jgi:hypothetical protein
VDSFEAAGRHRYSIHWSLPPGAEAGVEPSGFTVRYPDGQTLGLHDDGGAAWHRSVKPYGWSPAYGRVEPAWQLVVETEAEGPVRLSTSLRIGDVEQ